MPISFSFGDIRENPVAITIQLLRNLKIPVTETTITEVLKEHPDHPSLLSISDSLRLWKVNNVCLQLEPNDLNELSVPFIAHLKKGNSQFVAVTQISKKEISYASSEPGNKTVSKNLDSFLKEWRNRRHKFL